jgi:hypothetical protein
MSQLVDQGVLARTEGEYPCSRSARARPRSSRASAEVALMQPRHEVVAAGQAPPSADRR